MLQGEILTKGKPFMTNAMFQEKHFFARIFCFEDQVWTKDGILMIDQQL